MLEKQTTALKFCFQYIQLSGSMIFGSDSIISGSFNNMNCLACTASLDTVKRHALLVKMNSTRNPPRKTGSVRKIGGSKNCNVALTEIKNEGKKFCFEYSRLRKIEILL